MSSASPPPAVVPVATGSFCSRELWQIVVDPALAVQKKPAADPASAVQKKPAARKSMLMQQRTGDVDATQRTGESVVATATVTSKLRKKVMTTRELAQLQDARQDARMKNEDVCLVQWNVVVLSCKSRIQLG